MLTQEKLRELTEDINSLDLTDIIAITELKSNYCDRDLRGVE